MLTLCVSNRGSYCPFLNLLKLVWSQHKNSHDVAAFSTERLHATCSSKRLLANDFIGVIRTASWSSCTAVACNSRTSSCYRGRCVCRFCRQRRHNWQATRSCLAHLLTTFTSDIQHTDMLHTCTSDMQHTDILQTYNTLTCFTPVLQTYNTLTCFTRVSETYNTLTYIRHTTH
jgi:hypothetical protein